MGIGSTAPSYPISYVPASIYFSHDFFCFSIAILGYWSNGEFVVGMPGLTKVEASDRLFELLTTLRQQIFTAPDRNRFQVTCSYALTEYPADGLTLQSLYQAASTILHES